MKLFISLLCLGLSALGAAADITLYNVNFDDPPHTLNNAPANDLTGTATDRPFDTQLALISSGNPGFDGQYARLTDSGSNAYIFFGSPTETYETSLHSIMWEASMLAFDPSDGLQVGMTIGGGNGTGIDLNTRFLSSGSIVVSDPFDLAGEEVVGTWSTGQVFQFHAILDLDNDTYDYFLNGSQVIFGQSLESGASISAVSFQRPFVTSEFGLDNFSWTIVPEPATALLVMGGLIVSLGIRRRRHTL